jgi:hypothetical protein
MALTLAVTLAPMVIPPRTLTPAPNRHPSPHGQPNLRRHWLSFLSATGGILLVKAERSDGHWGRGPIYRAPGVGWGQHRKQNTPFANSILKGVEPCHLNP